jgi:type VI secretion system protein ImpA
MSASPEVIDIEALLSPIAGENPAGESLQYTPVYDEIREARRSEDPLSQGDWQREIKLADWDDVIRLSTDALTNRSKDLQICGWLAEALVKKMGFPGLRDGLTLARGLHERFWDNLYPEIEDGDLEARANAIALLDRQAAIALREVAITRSPAFSFLQWEKIKSDGSAPAAPEGAPASAPEAGEITLEGFEKARGASRRAFYEEMLVVLNECWKAFQDLDHAMDERFGRQTPGLGELKASLEKVKDWVDKTTREKRLEEPEGGVGGAEEAGSEGTGAATGAVRGRQDALRRLADVADYFRRTEPHSPVSYLVQRAIAWGQMPLDAWLGDVIKDGALLDNLRETLGLKSSTSSD